MLVVGVCLCCGLDGGGEEAAGKEGGEGRCGICGGSIKFSTLSSNYLFQPFYCTRILYGYHVLEIEYWNLASPLPLIL